MTQNFQLIPTITRQIFLVKQSAVVSFDVQLDVSQLPSASIVGFDFDLRVKRTLSQPGYDIYHTTGSVVSVVDFQTINVAFQPSDTVLLQPGDYYWESRLFSAAQGVDTRTPYSVYGELFLLQSL
jgi:hypothetical protein